MTYALIPLVAFLAIYARWVFFLAVMNLKRAKDAGLLSKTAAFLVTTSVVWTVYTLLFIFRG